MILQLQAKGLPRFTEHLRRRVVRRCQPSVAETSDAPEPGVGAPAPHPDRWSEWLQGPGVPAPRALKLVSTGTPDPPAGFLHGCVPAPRALKRFPTGSHRRCDRIQLTSLKIMILFQVFLKYHLIMLHKEKQFISSHM